MEENIGLRELTLGPFQVNPSICGRKRQKEFLPWAAANLFGWNAGCDGQAASVESAQLALGRHS